MDKIIATSIKTYFKLRAYTIDMFKMTAKPSQELIMFDLINTAKTTQFGQDYSFQEIQNYDDFKKNIPVMQYEKIFPYIDKMLHGERDVLWPGFISNFSKSSGTTNDVSKYIPVSHDALFKNNYAAGRDIYTIFFQNNPDSHLFSNKGATLTLGGSVSEPNEYGVKVGDISAYIMSCAPGWAEEYREPALDVALMEHWKEKIPAIINDSVSKNITNMTGVPTWFVSLFEAIKDRFPNKTIKDIWPNLELFVHGAVSFEPYRELFKKLFPGDDMKYMEVYSASEGFFAIQDNPDLQGEMLLLTDHGVFYEFIPMVNYEKGGAEAMTIHDVEVGVNYAMIISTNAGLWRYDLGDTVQFTSISPYRIKISGRTKHHINVFGEELMVGNTDEALSSICKIHDVVIAEYTAAPIFMNDQGKGGHEWLIEFKGGTPDPVVFAEDLDRELQSLNSDYKAKRQDNIALQPLVLHVAPEGTFLKWMDGRGKLGAQNKVPRLSNERRHLEDILTLIQVTNGE